MTDLRSLEAWYVLEPGAVSVGRDSLHFGEIMTDQKGGMCL